MPPVHAPAVHAGRRAAAAEARARELYRRARERHERATERELRKFLIRLQNDVLSNLKKLGAVPVSVAEIFEAPRYHDRFNRVMLPRWNGAIWAGVQFESDWIDTADAGRQSILQIAETEAGPPPSIHVDPSESQLREIRLFLERRAAGVWLNVGKTTNRLLRRVIERGIAEGLTFDQMEDLIRKSLKSYSGWEARRVARTEVTSSIGNGGQIERDEAGITHKQWIARLDERTRTYAKGAADHLAANRQTVANDKPFLVSGEQLMFPGDPDGSAANIIGCRCGAIAALRKRR